MVMRRSIITAIAASLTLLALLLVLSAPWQSPSRAAARDVMWTNPVGSSVAKVRYCSNHSCGEHVDTMMVMAKRIAYIQRQMLERTIGPVFVPSRPIISKV